MLYGKPVEFIFLDFDCSNITKRNGGSRSCGFGKKTLTHYGKFFQLCKQDVLIIDAYFTFSNNIKRFRNSTFFNKNCTFLIAFLFRLGKHLGDDLSIKMQK